MLWPIDPLGGLTLILEALAWAGLVFLIVVGCIAIAAEIMRR